MGVSITNFVVKKNTDGTLRFGANFLRFVANVKRWNFSRSSVRCQRSSHQSNQGSFACKFHNCFKMKIKFECSIVTNLFHFHRGGR